MTYDNKTLWSDFKRSVANNLKSIGIDTLDKVWHPNPDWTKFLKENLFYKVATDLLLTYEIKEKLTVDAIFYKTYLKEPYKYPINVPVICIESENNRDSISFSELYKLCFLNAPLKVIFTFFESWDKDKFEEYTSDEWRYVIDSFMNTNKLVGWLGFIVVVEKSDEFVFYSFVYDENGILSDEGELIKLTYLQ